MNIRLNTLKSLQRTLGCHVQFTHCDELEKENKPKCDEARESPFFMRVSSGQRTQKQPQGSFLSLKCPHTKQVDTLYWDTHTHVYTLCAHRSQKITCHITSVWPGPLVTRWSLLHGHVLLRKLLLSAAASQVQRSRSSRPRWKPFVSTMSSAA